MTAQKIQTKHFFLIKIYLHIFSVVSMDKVGASPSQKTKIYKLLPQSWREVAFLSWYKEMEIFIRGKKKLGYTNETIEVPGIDELDTQCGCIYELHQGIENFRWGENKISEYNKKLWSLWKELSYQISLP